MLWKKRLPNKQKPGITGTGRFFENLEWTLWDDARSPGLIGYKKFDALKALVLAPDERSKLALYAVRNASASRGPKHTPAEEQEASAIFGKLNAFLVDLRDNKFNELSRWLDDNLMSDETGRVVSEDGTHASSDILRVITAYVNCLELWGYGYQWERVEDSRGDQALLIRSIRGNVHVITKAEVQYVQGKPYRFEICMRGVSWYFEDANGFFAIVVRGREGVQRF